MALFNHAMKELTAKIVYYGPGLCGKTSNLKTLHQRLERGAGKLVSLSTAQDRTIYFDLLPIELGNIKGYTVRFQVCTVPGQVFYNETRKIVLRGVDGLVFVVDSQWSMLSHNLECFQNLKENLHAEKTALEKLPVVIQYNKRDLPSALSVEALQDSLGFHSYPYVETVASEGSGVIETFKLVSKLTFVDLLRRLQRGGSTEVETPAEEAPVLAVAGAARGSERSEAPPDGPTVEMPALSNEPPHEDPPGESAEAWVVPSADGEFPDLSDEAKPEAEAEAEAEAEPEPDPFTTSSPIEARPPDEEASPKDAILEPAVLLAALSVPPPAPESPEPPPAPPAARAAPPSRSSVDQKLDAVLAEARKAAGRLSGAFRRSDAAESTQEIPARELAERRLEESIASLRTELSGETAQLRDDLATVRAQLSGELARLREEIAAARRGAANAESAAETANERARRLEDALREAFRGLSD